MVDSARSIAVCVFFFGLQKKGVFLGVCGVCFAGRGQGVPLEKAPAA